MTDTFVMTPRQSLMWIEDQLHPGIPLNNMVTRLELRQPIDAAVFKQAFAVLVANHEAMRLIISRSGEQFVARIGDSTPELKLVDFSEAGGDGPEYQDWIQQQCRRVFELNQPLFAGALVKLSNSLYVFFINQHHCVTDGRTCQVMLENLDRYYAQLSQQRAFDDSEKRDQCGSFTDYLIERAQYLHSGPARDSEDYWLERYKTAPEPVRFYGRSTEIKKLHNWRHGRVLPPEISSRILAEKKRTPPSIVFAAVLFAFLRRVTGNSDLCLGVPLLNRPQQYARTLGLFMETSRNRLTVAADDTFATLLEKLRTEAADIKPHRSHTITTRNARYEALLNYRVPANTSFCGIPADLQRVSPLSLIADAACDQDASVEWAGRDSLTVDITHTPSSGEFFVAFEFNQGIWSDADSCRRSMDQFVSLLQHFFDHRSVPIDQLNITSIPELRLLSLWNDTRQALPDKLAAHQIFEAQAERTPDAIALEFNGQGVSYRDLNRQANRLADALIQRGVAAESLVGICINRSVNLITALLATLKAGAAYIPLDPAYPRKRLEMVIEEAAPALLLNEDALQELLASENLTENNPDLCYQPSSLAYVIFTSGSTGRPKGVMIEHGALTGFLHAAQRLVQLSAQHRLLSVTTVSFDIFALELFLPLTTGARMVLASQDSIVDGFALAEHIHTSKVTHLQATPATWHMLLDTGWRPSRPITGLVGGELLTTALAQRLSSACHRLWNLYGPTEATVWATALAVSADYQAGDVGQPLLNYQVHVLDQQGQPVPIGTAGEICIGGDSLARGYLNRPELTADAFTVSDSFGRLYRTGDLGRWCKNGRIEFLGRRDAQVKIRGFRIELGEIEAALLSHDAVAESAVVVMGEAEDKQLAAYIRATDRQAAGDRALSDRLAEQLRSHLSGLLPRYMVPAFFTLLEQFPHTPNGKVDRRSLPAPEQPHAAVSSDTYAAPETPLQHKLAAIWGETLNLERVGIRDSFFDLGGHSLMALQLVVKIEQATGTRLHLTDFFQGLTIEDISRQLSATDDGKIPASGAFSAIRAQGSLPPFFAVGSHPRYADAAARLDPEQPFYRLDVYALQSERIARGLKPLSRVERITAEFVQAIQRVQPRGPYFLGGGCEGALVALDIAMALQQRGEQVSKLILWITPAPGYGQTAAVFGKSSLRRLRAQLKVLFGHLRPADMNLKTVKEILQHEYIEYRIFRAMDRYRPDRVFDGEIILARTAEKRGAWDTDPALGWSRYASAGVSAHNLPGDHQTWLVQYAEVFGDLLASKLASPAH